MSILAVLLAALSSVFVCLTCIDWFYILEKWFVRWPLSFVFYISSTVFVLSAWRAFRNLPNAREAASKLDEWRDSHEHWTTLATLRTTNQSNAMVDQVAKEAIAQNSNAPWIIPCKDLLSLFTGSGVVIVSIAFILAIAGPSLQTLAVRLLAPWTSFTLTKLHSNDVASTVVRGTPIHLYVWAVGRVPSRATLVLRFDSGIVRRVSVTRSETPTQPTFVYEVAQAKNILYYRWEAGDAVTEWDTVTVVDHPAILDMHLTVLDPEYTDRPPTIWSRLPQRIEALCNSQLLATFSVDQPLNKTEVALIPLVAEDDMPSTRQPIDVRKAGENRFHFTTPLTQRSMIELELTGPTGLITHKEFRVEIQVDQPPTVTIQPTTDDIAMTKEDLLRIDFAVKDDFGVSTADLKLFLTDSQGFQKEIVQPLDIEQFRGHQSFNSSVDVDLSKLNIKPGDRLDYQIEVADLGGMKNATSSESPNEESAHQSHSQTESEQLQPLANFLDSLQKLARSLEDVKDRTASKSPNKDVLRTDTPESDQSHSELQNGSTNEDAAKLHKELSDLEAVLKPTNNEVLQRDVEQWKAMLRKMQDGKSNNEIASQKVALDELVQSVKQALDTRTRELQQQQKQQQLHPQNPDRQDTDRQDTDRQDTDRQDRGQQEQDPQEQEKQQKQQQAMPQYAIPKRLNEVVKQCSCSEKREVHIDEFVKLFKEPTENVISISVLPFLKRLRELTLNALTAIDDCLVKHRVDRSDSEIETLLNRALRNIADAERGSNQTSQKTKDTVYAFIGQQTKTLIEQGIAPAFKEIVKARETDIHTEATDDVFRDFLLSASQRLSYVINQLDILTEEVKTREMSEAIQRTSKKLQEINKSFSVLEKNMPQWLSSDRAGTYSSNNIVTGIDEEFSRNYQKYLDNRTAAYQELAKLLEKSPELREKFLAQHATAKDFIRDRIMAYAKQQSDLCDLTKSIDEIVGGELPGQWKNYIGVIETSVKQAVTEIDERMRIWMPKEMNAQSSKRLIELTRKLVIETMKINEKTTTNEAASHAKSLLEQIASIEKNVSESTGNAEWKLQRIDDLDAMKDKLGLYIDFRDGLYLSKPEKSVDSVQTRLAAQCAETFRRASLEIQELAASDKFRMETSEFFQWIEKEVGTPQSKASSSLKEGFVLESIQNQKVAAQGLSNSIDRLDQLIASILDAIPDRQENLTASPGDKASMLDRLMRAIEMEQRCAQTLGCKTCPQMPELNILNDMQDAQENKRQRQQQQKDQQKRQRQIEQQQDKKQYQDPQEQDEQQLQGQDTEQPQLTMTDKDETDLLGTKSSEESSGKGEASKELLDAVRQQVTEAMKAAISAQLEANAFAAAISKNSKVESFLMNELDEHDSERGINNEWNDILGDVLDGLASNGVAKSPETYREKNNAYFSALAEKKEETGRDSKGGKKAKAPVNAKENQ